MADLKISQLTSATTPLGGTEVLPIVQSSTTKKVATDDLTVKNVRSNATTGILQIAGPAAGTTRIMTTPNSNFTASRTDAAQSFTGDQTLGNGNLIQGTANKGFNFTANTSLTGMTSQLLNAYEQGNWTPTQGAGLTVVGSFSSSGTYTRIGRFVFVRGILQGSTSVAAAAGGAFCGAFPYTVDIETAQGVNDNASGASQLIVSGTTIYSVQSISASTRIVFSSTFII